MKEKGPSQGPQPSMASCLAVQQGTRGNSTDQSKSLALCVLQGQKAVCSGVETQICSRSWERLLQTLLLAALPSLVIPALFQFQGRNSRRPSRHIIEHTDSRNSAEPEREEGWEWGASRPALPSIPSQAAEVWSHSLAVGSKAQNTNLCSGSSAKRRQKSHPKSQRITVKIK